MAALAGGARADQAPLAQGSLLAFRALPDGSWRVIDLTTGRTRWRLPPGPIGGRLIVHRDGNLVTWFDADTGARVEDAVLQVHGRFALAGVSQDGKRAVFARTQTRSTTFVIASARAQRLVKLGGHDWSFDALNGQYLFLVEHGDRVRLYDLATNALQKQPLALPRGMPQARVSSPDGRYAFTLYIGKSGEAVLQELDTAAGFAHRIDLPSDSTVGAAITWGLVPDPSNDTLWTVSPGLGRVLAIDAPAHVVRLRYSFRPGRWNPGPVVGAIAPDGEHIVFTDAQHLWVAVPATGRVIDEPAHVALALGWAPDQSKVWVVGERSRVSALRLRLR
ncbi:MAG TPA: hypothetical protein VGF66_02775 [Gaiellaceae bacterium]